MSFVERFGWTASEGEPERRREPVIGGHPRFDEKPAGPVFFENGGGGGSGGHDAVDLRSAYWLWPLPGPGTIRVSCEWPLIEIPLSTVEIDGAPPVEAAERVVRLW